MRLALPGRQPPGIGGPKRKDPGVLEFVHSHPHVPRTPNPSLPAFSLPSIHPWHRTAMLTSASRRFSMYSTARTSTSLSLLMHRPSGVCASARGEASWLPRRGKRPRSGCGGSSPVSRYAFSLSVYLLQQETQGDATGFPMPRGIRRVTLLRGVGRARHMSRCLIPPTASHPPRAVSWTSPP